MAEGARRAKVERPGGLPLSLGLPLLAPVPGDRLTEQEGLGIQLLLCVDPVLIEAQLPRSLSPWQRESCPTEAEPSTPQALRPVTTTRRCLLGPGPGGRAGG